MQSRYIDHGVHLFDFMYSDQWVKCPKCTNCCILKYHSPQPPQQYPHQGTFSLSCFNCSYQIKPTSECSSSIHNGHYYATTSQRCQHCGGTWLNAKQKLAHAGIRPPYIQARCHLCKHISTFRKYELTFVLTQNIGYTTYGLELYLKTLTRHGEIFVFNPKHLNELKMYIQANLRERTTQTGNSSYFSRLPTWIKSARNRKEILKAILRLEQMSAYPK